ncbi:SWIM zinc finger family protein [Paenibacillus sp. BR2-3]|uniref:SWIM zinc finger family protein n=1 Tax=Paenibacillus sp. BR2-3 TaxID=3048494 RepID=UPI003977AE76
MAFYSGYPEYVPVGEKKKKAAKAIEKLKKKSPGIAPVVITGRTITRTWWGKSWSNNLESYSDYSNRIERGRSYVRHGAVLDLQITQGKISALVQGSTSKPYKIEITIAPLSKETWDVVVKECAGKIDSLQELIAGKFPKGLSELFTVKGKGLFPAPKEITLTCSCPDSAKMCKHVAAALYGVGARFDEDSALFFVLRSVNVDDLISVSLTQKSQAMLGKSKGRGRRVMVGADISDVFGIEVE